MSIACVCVCVRAYCWKINKRPWCTPVAERDIEPGYRSVMQENALIVSLQMFNLILERCASLFPAPSAPVTTIQALGDVAEDLQTLLPAIKVRRGERPPPHIIFHRRRSNYANKVINPALKVDKNTHPAAFFTSHQQGWTRLYVFFNPIYLFYAVAASLG